MSSAISESVLIHQQLQQDRHGREAKKVESYNCGSQKTLRAFERWRRRRGCSSDLSALFVATHIEPSMLRASAMVGGKRSGAEIIDAAELNGK